MHCRSKINSAEGLPPVGAQNWRCYVGGAWVERELTTAVTAELAAVAQQLQQGRDELATARGARQAEDPFELAGHPTAAYNGVYRHDSDHEGLPVMKNERGKFCYLYRGAGQHSERRWFLNGQLTPDANAAHAYTDVAAARGPLLAGAHPWQCYVDGALAEHTLTLTPRLREELAAAEARAQQEQQAFDAEHVQRRDAEHRAQAAEEQLQQEQAARQIAEEARQAAEARAEIVSSQLATADSLVARRVARAGAGGGAGPGVRQLSARQLSEL